jgi:hypothetical protein
LTQYIVHSFHASLCRVELRERVIQRAIAREMCVWGERGLLTINKCLKVSMRNALSGNYLRAFERP